MPKIAAIQMNSGADVKANLQQAEALINQAVTDGAEVVVLPENFALMGMTPEDKITIRESYGAGPIQDFLANLAAKQKTWIIAGTIPLESPDPKKVFASCLVFNHLGKSIARYDKMHLFDVSITATEQHRESTTILPGNNITVIDTPVGKIGLAICYDLRFPELFRQLWREGAEIFTLPSAFTVPTGTAHWEVLLRARAIENLCYMVAAAQTGSHPNNRTTYGHSMLIEPWGTIISQINDQVGYIIAEIDHQHLIAQRQRIPVTEHYRQVF